MPDNIEKRVQKLEEMLSYQEQTIDTLNDVIIEQQSQIGELQSQLQHLQALLTTKHDQPTGGEDPPPPHY